jgi:hypothetical protein
MILVKVDDLKGKNKIHSPSSLTIDLSLPGGYIVCRKPMKRS